MFIIIYILVFTSYIKINSYLYLSIYVDEVDDCIYNIYTYNNTKQIKYFNYTEKYGYSCTNKKYDIPLIKNKLYKFGDIIFMEAKDEISNTHQKNGFVSITVTINEYKLIKNNNKFWICSNCYGENRNYILKDNKYHFYGDKNKEVPQVNIYNFTFQVNSFFELNSSNSIISDSFYELSGKQVNLNLNYKDNELELINFNTKDIFYIKEDKNLSVNYTNYYFRVYFNKKFSGTLKGLNSDNFYININNNDFFRVNETNGLMYQLSPEDKKNYEVYLKLNITAYNIYLNKAVTKEKSFNFNIILTGDYLKCLNEESQNQPDPEKIYHIFCQNLTQDKLYNNISEFIHRIEENKKYEINGSDVNVYISPINSIFYKGSIQEKMTY